MEKLDGKRENEQKNIRIDTNTKSERFEIEIKTKFTTNGQSECEAYTCTETWCTKFVRSRSRAHARTQSLRRTDLKPTNIQFIGENNFEIDISIS